MHDKEECDVCKNISLPIYSVAFTVSIVHSTFYREPICMTEDTLKKHLGVTGAQSYLHALSA